MSFVPDLGPRSEEGRTLLTFGLRKHPYSHPVTGREEPLLREGGPASNSIFHVKPQSGVHQEQRHNSGRPREPLDHPS